MTFRVKHEITGRGLILVLRAQAATRRSWNIARGLALFYDLLLGR